MSSDKQIAANGLNARQSTGPRTPAGKIKVSMNAVKHGLTGREVVLPGEKPDEFDSFRTGLLASLDPQGDLEGALAEKIVADLWRLRRVPIFEATLYKRGCSELLVSQAAQSVSQYESTDADKMLALLGKKEVADRDRQAHADAEQRLERAQAQLDDPSFNVTRVLQTSPEPFLNLWRHEAVITRSMLRTLHELERWQAKRGGEHVPAPVVVDVDVSLTESSRPGSETDGDQQ